MEINLSNIYNKRDKTITTDPNYNCDKLLEEIIKAKDKYIRTKFVKFNKYKHKKSKWITNGILKSIRLRDKLYAKLKMAQPHTHEYSTHKVNLQTFNTIIKTSIRAVKKSHMEEIFTKHKNDTKNTWISINEILSKKRKKETTRMQLNINGKYIINELDMANEFNKLNSGQKTHKDYLNKIQNNKFKFR